MTRPVDGLIATLNALRPSIADTIMGDAYQIERDTRVSDGRGGYTITTAVVESGFCLLADVNRPRPQELISATAETVGIVTYEALMPAGTVLRATDRMLINGHTFRVIGVRYASQVGLFPIADLQAWDADN